MKYKLLIKKRAQKQLAKIAKQYQDRIINFIYLLVDDPRPPGTKKLTGRDAWRIRVGDYRIIYEINDESIEILVVSIGHRHQIYR